MTTPTGTITMLDVIEELDGTPTPRQITLNDADVRDLAGVPTGEISMDDLRGKSSSTVVLSLSFVVKETSQFLNSVGYLTGDPLTIISASGLFDGATSIFALAKATDTFQDAYYELVINIGGPLTQTASQMEALRGMAVVEFLLDAEPPRYMFTSVGSASAGGNAVMTTYGGSSSTILTTADIGKTCVLNVYPATDVLVSTFDLLPKSPIDDFNKFGWGVDWFSSPLGSITNVLFHNGFTGTAVPYAYVGYDNGDVNNRALQYCRLEIATSADETARNYMARAYEAGGTESTRYATPLEDTSYVGGSTVMEQPNTDRLVDWSDEREILVWYWDWQKAP